MVGGLLNRLDLRAVRPNTQGGCGRECTSAGRTYTHAHALSRAGCAACLLAFALPPSLRLLFSQQHYFTCAYTSASLYRLRRFPSFPSAICPEPLSPLPAVPLDVGISIFDVPLSREWLPPSLAGICNPPRLSFHNRPISPVDPPSPLTLPVFTPLLLRAHAYTHAYTHTHTHTRTRSAISGVQPSGVHNLSSTALAAAEKGGTSVTAGMRDSCCSQRHSTRMRKRMRPYSEKMLRRGALRRP